MQCANWWGLGPSGPSGLQGGALLLFSGTGSRERSGRDPVPVLSIPHPMDEVRGVFYSFFRGFRALPILSFFHICRPCGERESFQTRNLNSPQPPNQDVGWSQWARRLGAIVLTSCQRRTRSPDPLRLA